MANLNKALAVLFSFLFLYTFNYTESHYRFVLIQKEVNHSDNSDSHISDTCFLHNIPYNNQEKNFSLWKSASHWFTRLSPGVLPVSPDQIRNKGLSGFFPV
ncbi:MAG: hypothetical protein ACM3RX_00385 [Methanococcaceae archaeon]